MKLQRLDGVELRVLPLRLEVLLEVLQLVLELAQQRHVDLTLCLVVAQALAQLGRLDLQLGRCGRLLVL